MREFELESSADAAAEEELSSKVGEFDDIVDREELLRGEDEIVRSVPWHQPGTADNLRERGYHDGRQSPGLTAQMGLQWPDARNGM